MVAALRDNFFGVLLSVLFHGLLLVALLHSVDFMSTPTPPITASVIEAVVIDEGRRKTELAAKVAEQRRIDRQRREAEARRRREAERRRIAAEQAAKVKAAEAAKQAAAKAADEAAKRLAEQSAEQAAQQAAEQAAAEKSAAAARVARKQALTEQLRSEEIARQAAAEAATRKAEQKARQEALSQDMAAEQTAREQTDLDRLIAEYRSVIQARVQRNWLRPPGVDDDIRCLVKVNQLPDGQITDVKLVGSCGNTLLDASVEKAVYRSAPFPLAPDPRIQRMARELEFEFSAGKK